MIIFIRPGNDFLLYGMIYVYIIPNHESLVKILTIQTKERCRDSLWRAGIVLVQFQKKYLIVSSFDFLPQLKESSKSNFGLIM